MERKPEPDMNETRDNETPAEAHAKLLALAPNLLRKYGIDPPADPEEALALADQVVSGKVVLHPRALAAAFEGLRRQAQGLLDALDGAREALGKEQPVPQEQECTRLFYLVQNCADAVRGVPGKLKAVQEEQEAKFRGAQNASHP